MDNPVLLGGDAEMSYEEAEHWQLLLMLNIHWVMNVVVLQGDVAVRVSNAFVV